MTRLLVDVQVFHKATLHDVYPKVWVDDLDNACSTSASLEVACTCTVWPNTLEHRLTQLLGTYCCSRGYAQWAHLTSGLVSTASPAQVLRAQRA